MAWVLVAARAHVAEAVQHSLLIQDAVGVDEVFDELGIVRQRRLCPRRRRHQRKNARGAKYRAEYDKNAEFKSRHIASSRRQGVSVFLDDFPAKRRRHTVSWIVPSAQRLIERNPMWPRLQSLCGNYNSWPQIV